MDLDLEARMTATLKEAIAWAEARQKKLLTEVLALERRINCIHETKAIVRKKQVKQAIKEEVKEEDVSVKFSKKIDEMISKAQQQIQELDNTGKKGKPNATQKSKFVQPLPQIQKKPPIPTVNRSKDPQLVTHKPNYHYRNKNEVTGKITQTPYSKGKASSSSSIKKQEAPTIFHQSTQKPKNASQKLVKQESLNSTKTTTAGKDTRKEVHSLDAKQAKPQAQKVLYVDFCTFKTPIAALIERAAQKDKRKVGSKRPLIENLISEYNKNQLGYRQSQSKAMVNFLSSFNKLAVSRSRLHLQPTLLIESRARKPHIETFNFQNLLGHFQALLDANPISEEYAPNTKEIAKIKCWHKVLNDIFENQIQETRENLKLPPTLGIDFQMNLNEGQNGESFEQKEGGGGQVNPYSSQFFALLEQQLAQLKELDNFDKDSLRKLRTLISIGLYEGKRSPVLIQTQKYEQWKQYYQT